MKMLKFTQAFLLLVMLIAQGTNLCFADTQNIQEDIESDVEAFAELVQDQGRSKRGDCGRCIERECPPPSQNAKQRKVAFFVGLAKQYTSFDKAADIIFDRVVTNIGSGYFFSTGRFTAPVAGTYQFNINIAAPHTKSVSVVVLKNGQAVVTIGSVARPEWAPATNIPILSLNAGDQVWLQNNHPSDIYGQMYTTFSGFIIFED